jgi:hypothetical protein
MAKIPETGQATIGDIAEEWQGPKDLAELSKKAPLYMSGTEQVGIDDFRGKFYGAPTEATGGTVTEDGEYRYHTFTDNGTFEITKAADGPTVMDVDVLLVGAGGGTSSKAGGGGGGIVEEKFTSVVGPKTVVVGKGKSGAKGSKTTVTGQTEAIGGGCESTGGCGSGQVANGSSASQLPNITGKSGSQGGRGGNANAFYDSFQNKWYYSSGGSGGGGGKSNGGASYIEGSANAGGQKAGNGGAGKAAAINGVTYSGGGGGCPYNYSSAMGTGGAGGGATAVWDGGSGANGSFYGGGAGGHAGSKNGTGYQGIVVFRYRIAPAGSARTIDSTQFIAPKVESQPDYNPATHKAELNTITDPAQETVGWTVVEMTSEEKTAYAEAMAEKGDEE